MGWLADRALDGRIAMCAKELKWDVEQAPPLRRATILAIAQHIRTEFVGPMFPQECLDQPGLFGRAALGQYYWNLETVRNSALSQLAHLKRTMPNLGIALPAFSEQHMVNSNRALELWMCSIGAGINPKVLQDVLDTWVMLVKAGAQLDEAFVELARVEALTASLTGSNSTMEFSSLDRGAWRRECAYVPAHISGNRN